MVVERRAPVLPFRAMVDASLTVVGAGVVGLAIAARLAPRHPDLVILERNDRHGRETSSRNSEVIHAGLYYPEGSLKARLCVRGKQRLYELCARHDLPHRRIGKIVTATAPEEEEALEHVFGLGTANGVELSRLTAAEVAGLEPHVRSVAGLLSPSTGIVSAHALMDLFLHQAVEAGAVLQTRAELVGLERRDHDYRLTIRNGSTTESFTSETVVNAAGLGADRVAAAAGIDVDAAGYRLRYCKGSYFSVASGRAGLLRHLVYPVPGQISLGVHAVLGLDGRLRFGPDVEYLPDRRLEYAVDESKRTAFAAAARRLVPELRENDFSPDLAGIRPKLQGPGEPFRDFVVEEEGPRGLRGLVNLIGIDSPGLTAAPALAELVEGLLGG